MHMRSVVALGGVALVAVSGFLLGRATASAPVERTLETSVASDRIVIEILPPDDDQLYVPYVFPQDLTIDSLTGWLQDKARPNADGVRWRTVWNPTTGHPDDAVLTRERYSWQVRGRVLSLRGEPVAGARVVVIGDPLEGVDAQPERRVTRSGQDGEYVLRLESLPGSVRVAAIAPGHAPTWSDAERQGYTRWDADVTLGDGPRLRGRIVTPDGAAAVGAVVSVLSVRGEEDHDWFHRYVRPFGGGSGGFREPGPGSREFRIVVGHQLPSLGAEGAFETFAFVPAERLVVTVSLPGHCPLVHELPGPREQVRADLDLGVLELQRSADPVVVRVVDSHERPVPDVTVVFQSLAVPAAFQLNSVSQTTDSDGAVSSAFVEPGTAYHVFLRGAVHETLTHQYAPPSGEWVIRLPAPRGD